jgi:hypothetical protein
MKKIFLFLAVSMLAISFNSCSSDNGGASGKNNIKFKLDGHQKTFTSITITGQGQGADGQIFLTVEGTTNSGEFVNFGLYQGQTGNNVLVYFNYGDGTEDLGTDGGQPFTSNVATNSTTEVHIQGTFSGTLTTSGGVSSSAVTGGTFDITYNTTTQM